MTLYNLRKKLADKERSAPHTGPLREPVAASRPPQAPEADPTATHDGANQPAAELPAAPDGARQPTAEVAAARDEAPQPAREARPEASTTDLAVAPTGATGAPGEGPAPAGAHGPGFIAEIFDAPRRPLAAQGPWSEALHDVTLRLLQQQPEVLLLGLAPWSGAGWHLKLKAQANTIVAVDPDRVRLAEWRAACEVQIESTLESGTWSSMLIGRKFHSVVLGDALTHQPDPLTFLRRVRELLNPDGSLVAVVPNATWGEHRLQLLQGDLPRGYEPGSPLHRYNRDRLREALALSGFALVELYTHRTEFFDHDEALLPDLFPDTLLRALEPAEDATISHLVFRARPASPNELLSGLFQEQETLKRAVRNELARARREQEAGATALAEAGERQRRLEGELEEQRTTVTRVADRASRFEQSARAHMVERDRALRELAALQATWWYRLTGAFRRKPERELRLD
ncbi:MAG: methyltransferase domain-containing protein [Candidatus Sericytochromatia bacterium]|nr:methyltransferase domain-containing protein [Candidatus Sericytochromatia bacterium]